MEAQTENNSKNEYNIIFYLKTNNNIEPLPISMYIDSEEERQEKLQMMEELATKIYNSNSMNDLFLEFEFIGFISKKKSTLVISNFIGFIHNLNEPIENN